MPGTSAATFVLLTAGVLAGCGGQTLAASGDAGVAEGDASGDAGVAASDGSVDATRGDSGTAAVDAEAGLPVDSGSIPDTGVSTIPVNHRPSGDSCPQLRATSGASCAGCPPDAGFCCGTCNQDSDCTMGKNGRCLDLGPGPPVTNCSYDECFSDSDCPALVPCACRSSAAVSAPNVCLTGSSCRVDKDCALSGYCSPSRFNEWCGTTYFCHTPQDTCVNDSDCPNNQGCNFDMAAQHWACGGACGPPPP